MFREVNERIAELSESVSGWAPEGRLVEFQCECGAEGGCWERVEMTLAEYETVRAQDDRFALLPGHETNDIETVVERTERFVIVDKLPAVEAFVRDDPRGAPSE
jgi:hypothetical protein